MSSLGSRTSSLAALGDSSAQGRGDLAVDGRPRGWAERLARRLGVPDERVVNLAADGADTADVLDRQIPLAPARRPLIVAMSFGMNDAFRGFEPETTTRRLNRILDWAQDAAEVCVVAAPLPSPRLEQSGFSQVRVERVRERAGRYRRLLWAALEGRDVLALAPEDVPLAADPTLWSDDGLHLNSAGYELLAEAAARRAQAPAMRLEAAEDQAREPRPRRNT